MGGTAAPLVTVGLEAVTGRPLGVMFAVVPAVLELSWKFPACAPVRAIVAVGLVADVRMARLPR